MIKITPHSLRETLRRSSIVRSLYFDLHMADIPVLLGFGNFKAEAEKAMKMFLSEKELKDDRTVAKVEADIRHCFYKFKTTPQEYFLFGFRKKTDEERNAYLPDSLIMKT